MRLFKSRLFPRLWLWRLLKRQVIVGMIVFVLYLFSVPLVSADKFYPSGDTKLCQFAQAAAISYSDLPVNGVSSGFTFNNSKLKGVTLNWIKSTDFEDIGDVTYPDARRKNGIASSISVPPNTSVNLDVYYYNFSGHNINILDAIFYTSMPNPSDGDLTRLGAPGVSQSNSFLYGTSTFNRGGKMHSVKNWKNISPHSLSNLPKGEALAIFKTIQPIKLVTREVTPEFRNGALYLKYRTEIENTSSYPLGNIEVRESLLSGQEFFQKTSFVPGEKKVFTYEDCLCKGYERDLYVPRLSIKDPNSHRENSAIGSPDLFSFNASTRVFLTRRNDTGAPSNWSAIQGDFTSVGAGDFIEIELLPYEIHSEIRHLTLKPDITTLPIIDDISRIISPDEKVELGVEISNQGGFINDISASIDFDSSIFEFIGDENLLIDEDTVTLKKKLLENSEFWRPEFTFKPLTQLLPGEYNTTFNLYVNGGEYEDFTKLVEVRVVVNEPDKKIIDSIKYSTTEPQIDYLSPEMLKNEGQKLASTGQLNFYLYLSFIIMIAELIRFICYRQKLHKKSKRFLELAKLRLRFHHM